MKSTPGVVTLQPSLKDESNRFYLFSDSSWNFVCNIISGLQQHYPWLRLVLLCPNREQLGYSESASRDLRDYATAQIDWSRVLIHHIYYCPYIFLSRHHFDSRDIFEVCRRYSPRFAWVTDPCQVLAWKTALHYNEATRESPVICCNNWIDVPSQSRVPPGLSFLISQIEGTIHSELTFLNSQAAIQLFEDSISRYLSAEMLGRVRRQCHPMAPGIDTATVDALRPPGYPTVKLEGCDVRRPVRIIFNHRINDLAFYRSNWETTFNLLRILYAEGHPFEVLCTDIVSEPQRTSLQRDYPFLRFTPQPTYQEYIATLWSCDIGLGFFSYEGMWSMSLVESMATFCATIVPNHSGYLEIAPQGYRGLTAPEESSATLALLRRLLTDAGFRQALADTGARHVRKAFSNVSVIKSIGPLIERFV